MNERLMNSLANMMDLLTQETSEPLVCFWCETKDTESVRMSSYWFWLCYGQQQVATKDRYLFWTAPVSMLTPALHRFMEQNKERWDKLGEDVQTFVNSVNDRFTLAIITAQVSPVHLIIDCTCETSLPVCVIPKRILTDPQKTNLAKQWDGVKHWQIQENK